MVVDFVMSSTFEEVNLDEEPCTVPLCGRVLTLECMDGLMSMSDFYLMNGGRFVGSLKSAAKPFSASGLKKCPACRGCLRNLNRYGRIIRRTFIDEGTKKFIVWANSEFVPLIAKMQDIEAELRKTSNELSQEDSLTGPYHLNGTRDNQITYIRKLTRTDNRYRTILAFRGDIKKFLRQVNEREQPFGRIFDLVQEARRHRGINAELYSGVDILQVRSRLLTTLLLIRCDYNILLTFINDRASNTAATTPSIKLDMSVNREDCERLIAESDSRDQPGNSVEGHLYWARFVALERRFVEKQELLDVAIEHLRLAQCLCDQFPGQTPGMENEIKDVERMLRDSTFYLPVNNEEKAAVYAAMARDFRGTGHWYYCVNGHPFTVGECGMPMKPSRCPQCGSRVGGHDHRAIDGVTPATNFERQFGAMEI